MKGAITVYFNETKVGVLIEARGGIFFEYDPGFIDLGIELSPLNLPLGSGLRSRAGVPEMRLPGLFEDSLPDRWGHRIMAEWFLRRGTKEHQVSPLMMLSYVGDHGMGALRYEPALLTETLGEVSLQAVHAAAMEAEQTGKIDLNALAEVGSSAGGARPKALIGLPDEGEGPVLAGTRALPRGYSGWLVKFDTGSVPGMGAMEEAYARMARAAGIEVPETRLIETLSQEGPGRRHFAVRRFDRIGNERVHYHSLSGLCHLGGGDFDYQLFLRVVRRIARDEREVWKAYRRAVFNVLASNRDDHGKNQGFLMHGKDWKLSPVFDLTFMSPRTLPERGMALCGERRAAGLEHLKLLAQREGLETKRALEIIDEVKSAIELWPDFADRCEVPQALASGIATVLKSH
ncbi:MAG: type II toxin-antitoxin system HipA family toxin [Opitutaceae bacterium]|jgi:serine/threonine-protein kinase HipA